MWFTIGSLALGATLEVGPTGAYATINDALDDAGAGDTVRVAPGVYREVVWVEGPVTLESTGGAAQTVIAFPPSYGWTPPVVYVIGAQGAVIRGFTIDATGTDNALSVDYSTLEAVELELFGAENESVHGFQSDLTLRDTTLRAAPDVHPRHIGVYQTALTLERVVVSKGFSRVEGGGLFAVGSDVTVRDCTFSDNVARSGAAIDAITDTDTVLTVEDTVFERNRAEDYGAGIRVEGGGTILVRRSSFVDNHGVDGIGAIDLFGGATHFELADSQFVGNTGEAWGGTVAVYDVADALVARNTFVDNRSGDYGGALRIDGSSGVATVVGNSFCGNTATEGGGAVVLAGYDTLSASVIHNLFVDNDAPSGGAVYVEQSEVALAQNTVVGGSTGDAAVWFTYARGSSVNGVFADLGAPPFGADPASDVTSTWSLSWDVSGASLGIPADPSLVEADPGFAAYTPGDCGSDLRGGSGSALVDGGDPGRVDADGSRSDLGAYGGETAVLWLDVDGDGLIEGDCAPLDPAAGAGGDDLPADGVEPDCDGAEACWVDRDSDGVGSDELGQGPVGCDAPGWAGGPGDCDDRDPAHTSECGAELPRAWFCGTTPDAGWLAGFAALALGRRRSVSAPRAGRRAS
ncbi:MAG: right-handed parallel beta-helix repeat-containing protein [Myxococcota bacterium]